jgi:tRNA pseudouridine55 synthase
VTEAASGPEGVLVVDKPAGMTSHDVVARVRRLTGVRRVGHAGTLDPMATGVLVIGVGKATRLLTFVVGADKEYLATIRLGESTDTDDAEGAVVSWADAASLTGLAVQAAVEGLRGDILQRPSSVSAIRVEGKRAYARVRAGESVNLPARPIHVGDLRVLGDRPAFGSHAAALDVDVRVQISSGGYVRALARDLGAQLGVGGHLTSLRRLRVGGFALADALDLAEAERGAATAGARPAALPFMSLAAAARIALPARELSATEAGELAHGRAVRPDPTGGPAVVAAFAPDGRLVAVLENGAAAARSLVVFSPAG